MAGNVQDLIRDALMSALEGSVGSSQDGNESSGSNGGLSAMKGLAAGAGAAALAPVALKGVGRLAKGLGIDGLENAVTSPGEALGGAASSLGDRLTSSVTDQVEGKLDEAGGPGGILKEAAKSFLPFGGGDGDSKDGNMAGVGKGRRMPVQQTVDIALPLETVYNQWTQFEDWPNFMHRVTRVTQEDECTVSFAVKVWGKTKDFTANIETQRPDDRIKWSVSQGMTHTGVVSFRELAPGLTRVEIGFDVDPGGLVEKLARGARHIKRAARGDFHRFKAFIEMAEQETGAWRGVIEDGELVEEHDPSYDEQRQYSDLDELMGQESEGGEEEDGEEEEEPPAKKRSQTRQRSGGGNRQKQGGTRGRSRAQASSRRGQSRSSGQSRAGRGSSRAGGGGSRGDSSRPSGQGRSSQKSSSGRSASRGRTKSQSSKR